MSHIDQEGYVREILSDVQAERTSLKAHLLAKSQVIEKLETKLKKAQLALGFFSSVIKAGEKWTAKCQRTYDLIMAGE